MKKTLSIFLIVLCIISCNRIKPETRVISKTDKDSLLVIGIPKVGCHNCQKVVEGGLVDIKGIKQTILNLHTKEVSIVYNPEITNSNTLENKVKNLAQKIPCK
ncbi:heavy-metal-associated domain-containing protein [uncultured Tenacibaculum sp.]|uniref:heavy-metal-associated domain-containing protein n=1 Tax=uncultured Tenacibaculum sp. TaxID=174713 RepID=UPI0026018B07|nr:heavy-metal-associated domain-containing protein [uncultured Tenacibaculum sp.]